MVVLCLITLSLFPFRLLLPQTSDGQTFCICVCRTEYRRLLRAQHVESHSNKHCDITPGQDLALALLIVFFVFSALLTCALVMCLTRSQPFVFAFSGSLLPQQVMDRLSSSASTVPSIDDYSEHNMWNPLLELLFLEHVNGIIASYLVEIDMAMIALSCHFALDVVCYKEGVYESA